MKYIILSHKGIRLKKDRVLPHGSKVDAEDLQDLNIEFLLAGGFIGIEKTTNKKMEDND